MGRQPLSYVWSDEFRELDINDLEAEALPVITGEIINPKRKDRLAARGAVISREDERKLFRRMNFHKYLATCRYNQRDYHLACAKRDHDTIFFANLQFVCSYATRGQAYSDSDRDDVVSDGIVLLLRAILNADYTKKIRFTTFLYYGLAHITAPSAIDSKKAADYENVTFYRDFPPELSNLCLNRKNRETQAVEWFGHGRGDSEPFDSTGERRQAHLRQQVAELIARLNPVNQYIVHQYYFNDVTLVDLAEEMGLTRQAVSLRLRKLLRHLRNLYGNAVLDLIEDDECEVVLSDGIGESSVGPGFREPTDLDTYLKETWGHGRSTTEVYLQSPGRDLPGGDGCR